MGKKASVAALGMFYPSRDVDDPAKNRDACLRLIAAFPTLVAAFSRVRRGEEVLEPRADLDHAANFYYMLFGREPTAATRKVLDACNPTWRIIVALSRFAGLRCPSEVLSLKWEHVNFETNRMTVPSCKTEHYPGRAYRVCPIFAELRPFLDDAWELAEPGAEYVVPGGMRLSANRPGGWNNTQAKFVVKKLEDGNTVLAKVNTDSRPPFARANGYITLPDSKNYTIQADLMGTEVRNRMPDIGLVNSRYTLILDGKADLDSKKRQLRLVSWEARPRVYQGIEFDWQPGVWYTARFSVESTGDKAIARGKVWKKGEAEPEKWMIEFEDPAGNTGGSAALYGYVSDPLITAANPGSEAYYDNVTITPNK